MNCSLSNIITDFYKGQPLAGISTGLFFLVLNNIYKICKSEEKQMTLNVIIIA